MNDASLPDPATATGISLAAVLEVRDQCLCLASQRAARLLARRFDRLFAPLGITNGQFSMMVSLSGQWNPRLGELADFLAMDSTTMTAAIRTLEKKGLVQLEADASDARARRPSLTDAGRGVVAKALPLWRAEHAIVQAELPGQNAVELSRILGTLR